MNQLINFIPKSTISTIFENKLFFVMFVCFFYIGYNSDHLYLIFFNKTNDDKNKDKDKDIIVKEEEKEQKKKPEIKYQDKYLEKVKMNQKDDFEYNKEEKKLFSLFSTCKFRIYHAIITDWHCVLFHGNMDYN